MSEETKNQLEVMLNDWKCFTWHTDNDRRAVIEAILDIVICGSCDLEKEGACVKA